jgi:hypothetical protein
LQTGKPQGRQGDEEGPPERQGPLARKRIRQLAKGRGRVAAGVYWPNGVEGEEEVEKVMQMVGTRTRGDAGSKKFVVLYTNEQSAVAKVSEPHPDFVNRDLVQQ